MKTINVTRLRRAAQLTTGAALLAGLSVAWAQAQTVVPPEPELPPLGQVAVPDVNQLGILDGTGVNASTWTKITRPGNKENLKILGKALFWDMQVGGDGVQACATCHFHAGADNRQNNQVKPGPGNFDWTPDLVGINGTLSRFHYSGLANGLPDAGFPVSEQGLIAAGAVADAADGTPGVFAKLDDFLADVNDIVSSQGIRRGEYQGNGSMRGNKAKLALSDPEFFFDFPDEANAAGIPDTVRQVPGRNSPSVLNAVFNYRNFWDGRADPFFNGVNPLGVRDQNAAVKTFALKVGKPTIVNERLRIPYSSLASQAVGPLGSTVEVIYDGRPLRELGRLMTSPNTIPLDGQSIAASDSLLGALREPSTGRGLSKRYSDFIKESFDKRFWADDQGREICVSNTGSYVGVMPVTGCLSGQYTLMQWNFPLFFGLAVQAYEATLVTGETIVDLIGGGVAKGSVSIPADAAGPANTIDVTGLSVDACAVVLSNVDGEALPVPPATLTPEQQAQADRLGVALGICEAHYVKFIHPRAISGSESMNALSPIPNNSPIGGCDFPLSCVASPNEAAGIATLHNVTRGLGRFSAGATRCALCHTGPEFTGATVAALTGFGFFPHPPEPGVAPEVAVPLERMLGFNANVVAYDAGFYNIGVRPTIEDVGVGGFTNGVPKSWAKILEVINGGNINAQNASIGGVQIESTNLTATKNAGLEYNSGKLLLPTSPTDMKPKPWKLHIGCDPALVEEGILPANYVCRPTVGKGEPISRNGSFKTPGLRNVKYTGPYMHNGSKATLRQVLEFYKTAGHFTNLNFNNLHEAMRGINLGIAGEASLVEFMETGLTDWRVAYQQAPFDHPELCLPNGHDYATGKSYMTAVPAVGAGGYQHPLATFEEIMNGFTSTTSWDEPISMVRSHTLTDGCTVPGVSDNPNGIGLSQVDVPEYAPMP